MAMPGLDWIEAPWSSGKPLPIIKKSSPLYAEAQSQHERIVKALASTIDKRALGAEIVRLAGHYHVAGKPEPMSDSVAEDYIRILAPMNYPAAVIRKAIDKLLVDTEVKFFPRVAELKERFDHEWAAARWRMKRLGKLVEKAME